MSKVNQNMENNKVHLDYLDLAKGIGILTVVLGHGMFPNHFLIDSFHMPLFFILSGITFTHPNKLNTTSTKEWLLKKIERIFVPYLFFAIISSVIELVVGRINPSSPFNSPLWFLQTLFCSFSIYYCVNTYMSNRSINLMCILIAASTYYIYKYTSIASVLPFAIYRALVAMVFIHLGTFFSNYYKKEQKKTMTLKISTVAVFVFMSALYISIKSYNVTGLNFHSGSIFTYNIWLPWLLAISGSISVLYVSKLIKSMKPLNWMGINSLVIMCVHFPLIERLNMVCASLTLYQSTIGKMILALTSYVITISFSCLMVYVCKRTFPQLTGYSRTFLTR